MNFVARVSNTIRHGGERSALWVGSHNCYERGEEQSICV